MWFKNKFNLSVNIYNKENSHKLYYYKENLVVVFIWVTAKSYVLQAIIKRDCKGTTGVLCK